MHSSIREDPSREKKEAFSAIDKSFRRPVKKTYEERKSDAATKKTSFKANDVDEEEEEEDEDA
ncbi:hypothetical protein EON63_05265 [archaeon]|nr:MAG: hypothetical protein EON63_05265 [archaeon]